MQGKGLGELNSLVHEANLVAERAKSVRELAREVLASGHTLPDFVLSPKSAFEVKNLRESSKVLDIPYEHIVDSVGSASLPKVSEAYAKAYSVGSKEALAHVKETLLKMSPENLKETVSHTLQSQSQSSKAKRSP